MPPRSSIFSVMPRTFLSQYSSTGLLLLSDLLAVLPSLWHAGVFHVLLQALQGSSGALAMVMKR